MTPILVASPMMGCTSTLEQPYARTRIGRDPQKAVDTNAE